MDKYACITENLLDWYDLNRRVLPWRVNRTPYGTWISEIMLQQTRVAAVIPYYANFLKIFPDISSLSSADEDRVYKAWEGLGYYSRARNLIAGARFCADHFGGTLPADYETLLTVPGIGPYTAGAIASLAFGQAVPAVDGNVIRVASRLFALFIRPQDPLARAGIAERIRELLPDDRAGDFNEALMDLGASVCIPGNPDCAKCPLSNFCEAFMLGKQKELPLKKEKKEKPTLTYTMVVLTSEDHVFIRKRPDTGLLSNLYEFPYYPGYLHPGELEDKLLTDFDLPRSRILSIESLGGASHVFSHLRWEMEGYHIKCSDLHEKSAFPLPVSESAVNGAFYPIREAKKLAFPSALKVYKTVLFRSGGNIR